MSTIAVLGGADGSLGTIRAAQQRGLRTICVDQRGDAPGALAADELLNISTDRVADLVDALADVTDLAAVVSPASDVNLPSQYALAQALGLPNGLSAAAVRASVDKGYFRSVCDELGLPGPRYVQGGPEDVLAAAATMPMPVMVKPTDSSGSRGVRCVADPAELTDAVAEAVGFSASGVVIVEEFVAGRYYTAEAVVSDGRVAVVGVSERRVTPLPHFVTVDHRMRPGGRVRTGDLVPALDALCAALEYRWGALNVDLIMADDGRLVIDEAGARLGGNGMAELLLLSQGVDATAAYVRMSVGEPVVVRPRWERCAAMHVLQAPSPGKLTAIGGLQAARQIPGVRDIVLAVQPGEHVYRYTRAGAKLGYLLADADTDAALDRVVSAVDATLRFMVEDQR